MRVVDQGIGMAPDEVENIFKPFWRAKNSSSERIPVHGNSYGLSICKSICNQLDGNITVSSHIGWGSAFTFTMKGFRTKFSRTEVIKNHL